MNNKIKIQHLRLSTLNHNKGFALLVAVVVSTLMLSIGAVIFNTTIKELRLSSLGRDSQFAFYAADSGIECALFWDIRGHEFATSTDSDPTNTGTFCAGQDITESGWSVVANPSSARSTFKLTFPEGYCATVVVNKTIATTTIESRGYNTCVETNPKRVERALRSEYQ